MAADPAPAIYVRGQSGYDISWPQCGTPYPPQPFQIAIVGVNDGSAFTDNPCFASEAKDWAVPGALDVYLNVNSPTSGFTGGCTPTDVRCVAYRYGVQAAQYSINKVKGAALQPRVWWLDVEVVSRAGYWSGDTSLNALTIQGNVDALRGAGLLAGIYATKYQWGVLTDGYTTNPALPLWAPGSSAYERCNEPFGGGFVWLSQVLGAYSPNGFDLDYAC